MDKAHQQADKDLNRLSKRIKREYQTAQKEIIEKANAYFEEFEQADKRMFKMVDTGKISRDDYIKWRKVQLAQGDKWRDTIKAISRDYANIQAITADMTNEHMDYVYANNYNYGTYEIEEGLGISTNYTLYNKDTVKQLLVDNPDLLPKPDPTKIIPKAERWNMQKVNSALLQGILQGDSIDKIAKRLRTVTKMNISSSIRNARTMTTRAENGGRYGAYNRAEKMGIRVKKQWIAAIDSRTRHSHAMLDGAVVEMGEKFDNELQYPGDPDGAPSEVYNCFVAETSVSTDSDIVRSYKHLYEGELLTIKSASGIEFTCTPNHPILTRRGWVKANALNNRDDLIVTIASNNIFMWGNPHIQHTFTRFDTLHKFFDVTGGKRISTLRVNFHGDVPTTDVEIITKKCFLRNNRNIGLRKRINKLFFKFANSSFLRQCSFMKHFRSIFRASLCFVSRSCKTFSFFLRSLGHSDIHRLRPIALLDSYGMKSFNNYISRDTELLGKCLNGFTGFIFADNIVNINSSYKCTHVYNLQSVNGYYFVNNSITEKGEKDNGIKAIAHNCRCTMVAIPYGLNEDIYTKDRVNTYLNKSNITYDEWKEGKR